MPIYEYDCAKCGKGFEAFLKSKDEKVVCPNCKGSDIRKRLSTFSAVSSSGGAPECPSAGECPSAHCCTSACRH